MLVQRDAELICSFEYNVQELVEIGNQAVAPVCIELGVEVLIGIDWEETDEAWAMLYREVLT